jgi:DnaJ-class molecular chaperone
VHVAVLGGEVEVPTPKGTKLALRLPPETQNGRRFRLKGQGMPHLGGGGHGDLFADVQVVLPTQLNDEERKLFERLAELRSHAGVTR